MTKGEVYVAGKMPAPSKVRADAFDFPVAIAGGVEAAAAGDFLGRVAGFCVNFGPAGAGFGKGLGRDFGGGWFGVGWLGARAGHYRLVVVGEGPCFRPNHTPSLSQVQQFKTIGTMLNAVRTTFLLAAMTGLFMAVGFIVGGQGGMMLALGFSIVTNMIAYWNADKIVLRMQNAEPLDPRRAPEIYEAVEVLSQRAGIPMPKLYLIHSDQPNAFATGRNPENAAVAVSSGLVQHLTLREVSAVIAHELAHIRSRDTLTMTITATLAGAISMLAQFGLFFGGRNSNNPLGPFGALAMVIVAPLAAMMVQMAISRTREYEADRDGAEISGDPLALASALEKISHLARNFENRWARRTPGLAHMYIVNPLAGDRMDNLFATHPNVHNRIAALQQMAAEMPRNTPPRAPARGVRGVAADAGGNAGWRVPTTRRQDRDAPPKGPWG